MFLLRKSVEDSAMVLTAIQVTGDLNNYVLIPLFSDGKCANVSELKLNILIMNKGYHIHLSHQLLR